MKVSYITFCFFVATCFLYCASDSKPAKAKSISQNNIYAKYYVRYLQAEKELKAEVSFRAGDSLKTAQSIVMQNVRFDGNEMQAQNLGKKYGVRYGFRQRSPYSRNYDFVYEGDFGTKTYKVGIAPITEFLFKTGAISKSKGTTLTWDGEALTKEQGLVLLFTDEQKKAFTIQVKGPTPDSSLELSPKQLEGLNPGRGALMLIKKQLSVSNEKQFSHVAEMEFYSSSIEVEITE